MILTQEFEDYYSALGCWRPLHYFPEDDENALLNRPFNNNYLGNFLHCLIDRLYPKIPMRPKPTDIPQYVPLKISVLGPKFSGKKNLANLLKQKYGLVFIDLKEIIKEATTLAAPPVEDEKDKKKAAKKDIKIEEKKVNPELIALGEILVQYKDREIPDDIQVNAVIIKIREHFPLKSNKEILEDINNSIKKEEEKAKERLVVAEDKNKKATKKDAKKEIKKAVKEEVV